MNSADRITTLSALLREVRALVMLPDNDFSWSSWIDETHAAAELDGLLAKLARGARRPLR